MNTSIYLSQEVKKATSPSPKKAAPSPAKGSSKKVPVVVEEDLVDTDDEEAPDTNR
jgi:hypothetical protein